MKMRWVEEQNFVNETKEGYKTVPRDESMYIPTSVLVKFINVKTLRRKL